jgi:hypothetical protein
VATCSWPRTHIQARHPATAFGDFGVTWERGSEVEVYASEAGLDAGVGEARSQEEYWNDMGAWQFGHPRGVPLPDGQVFVAWYGGARTTRPARWARVTLDATDG